MLMEIDCYLIDLIKRMSVEEKGVNSDDSVSWKAYREAESLDEERFIKQLMDYLTIENNKTFRDSAYFILGKLLMKFTDKVAIQFYIDRLIFETDKYVLSHMLDRLKDIEKEQSIELTPIIQCTESEKWLVRYSAINALTKTNHEAAKSKIRAIVQLDDQKKYKYEIVYAVATLGTVGEIEDIALLKPLFSSRIRDIRDSAKFAAESLSCRSSV